MLDRCRSTRKRHHRAHSVEDHRKVRARRGTAMTRALSGIRVIDMTSTVMGPSATQRLGDHGADVIKVESAAGDTTRQVPPHRSPDMGVAYLQLNRNKRSVVLDLKRDA